MEKELVWLMVQGQIGYNFKNLDLLKQAFTRRSYTEENGSENNEVLEFIGDKALDYVVVKLLIEKYGHSVGIDQADSIIMPFSEKHLQLNKKNNQVINENFFHCDYNEDELTRTKSRMVSKRTLASRMDELGFSEHLIMGNGDIQNNINEEDSVKEDLFEAIIGAVVIDSNWNQKAIQSVVEAMLAPDDFLVPKNKPCKRNNRQNLANTKTAAKESNAEERLHAGCEIIQ